MFKLFALVFAALVAVVSAKPAVITGYGAPIAHGYGYTGYGGYASPLGYSGYGPYGYGYAGPLGYGGYGYHGYPYYHY